MPKTLSVASCPAVSNEKKLVFEVVSTAEHLSACRNDWNSLAEAAEIAHPFLTHDWVSTWWECFGAGNTLFILFVKCGGNLVAIAPLMLSRRRLGGVPLRTVEFIANLHTPRFDFIVAPGHSEVYQAIWSYLLEARQLWDVILLSQMPGDSPTLPELIGLAQDEHCPAGLWLAANSPYLSTKTQFETYFSGLRAKHRSEIRRRLRRLSELGGAELEMCCSQTGIQDALCTAFDLEGAAWKDGNGTSIRAGSSTLPFYRNIARRFAARGQFELQFLKIQGKRIAVNICLRHRNRIFLLKPGYDPQFASYSPGNLLCYLYFQQIFGSGIEEFDFLGQMDPWKREWAAEARRHYWLYIFSQKFLPSVAYLVKFGLLPPLRGRAVYEKARRFWIGLRGRLTGDSD